jgi:carbamoyl-phosphate synthase / aspartate carbamoyltransferase / dihydroorotase
MLRIPGLIDPHVHLREPGATHKEDWASGTAAALAGGFTLVLAMPNTSPPVCNADSLHLALDLAGPKACCDYAQYLGAGPENAKILPALAARAAGLKLYLDQTYGPLRLEDQALWAEHFQNWPVNLPLCIHAEGKTLAAALQLAEKMKRPVHFCHVSRKEEILLIRAAKERGAAVTCEVTPHHLFLTDADFPTIGTGRAEVRPRLASAEDQQALWQNLEVIDCFASDHAPHTLAEKDSSNPPPGFPGVETALPLYLNAIHEGRLTLADVIARCHTNPRRLFHLPQQPDTWVEVDEEAVYEIHAANLHSRCGWTPYEGWQVRGKIQRVVLRGCEVYRDGRVLGEAGFGRNIRSIKQDQFHLFKRSNT